MTPTDLDAIMGAVEGVCEPLFERIRALETELEALKARSAEAPSVKFVGPWRDGREYAAGTACVRGGSLWIAARAPRRGEIPGAGAPDGEDAEDASWKLAAKKGKDANVSHDIERRLMRLEQRIDHP
jgi:hypothetical protein